ncbi:tRNA preQ1(34) S-adenosylmethionine ribosyltransferase-isomerase QueA [Olsenella sp. AF16-14LB]|jgi:S-adenosylmethionine:tRNA ribosyltransferase-isomerase|uniref:tRNA preQ1(34) S-adenosylmethionine ribosyltransferase-isomerase QueA n=1 Tax=Atopobiaceae TaxID=1643824 RepID=UPI000509F82E|nr:MULTISPECIES: tRNA preQ1(34) S-adenosylmethionine ribosyltransferase-isomerase QueA [unclassified Olsenella]MCI2085513.1 tRNA preQ1(34) S-adenosylmethionine ribosyltransferase-isomerase QueA [Olsenella sp.]RGJ47735.1 tRNA preQ1(34) S-adenosylmethionine ribosyltransferase-isomerase QueA [Olsenella sp. TM06-36]RGS53306.1 tRNA preQ1(34) S-adenosylmethionine ribosyltransferase-isomerase QueA [Olsenella sp. AF21-51]RGU50612.1 tRNA preQ1(34) S-adenosylmethionine ribosyltransferase-isomerase QueA [
MRTDDFDYPLPDELIAQAPAEPRDSCRLLVLNREDGSLEHRHFTDVIDYLDPGDLLVANKTRVMPARLVGHKRGTGGVAETLLLKRREDLDPLGHVWECLVNPGKRLRQPGTVIEYRAGGLHAPLSAEVVLTGEIVDFLEDNRGGRLVRFEPQGGRTLDAAIHEAGHVPLPPYITKYEGDPEKYQTVYAMHEEHSAAAPTAGLHFTPELIKRIEDKGVGWKTVELEVGIDTFRLVTEDDPTKHVMHTERYHVPQDVVDAVHATKAAGHRVVAVGTTAVRSLESAWDPEAPASTPAVTARRFEGAPDSAAVTGRGDIVERRDATTNLYLMPGSTYHVVDALITNFHVPRSTLMMLVSALATREQIMAAYQAAIDERYRFLSFGDAMLIR